MQVAHNRQYPDEWLEEDGGDPDAFKPPASEKLDLELMIRGYTINGAYPFRMENDIGSIEVGKLADLVVLEEDVFSVDRRRIHAIEPTAVMMEGMVVSGALP
jgi:predicted amidohydrolase YtcJ